MPAVEMEGVLPAVPPRCTYAAVLCCVCGCRMASPSPQSTCLACLAQQTDITEGISRSVVLPCCGTCGRYMHTQNRWLPCELESRELMALMLQKIRGLKKVAKVLDSNWVWREPHSRRVTLKLTVQKEILDGRASVKQALLVEGVIQTTQCDDCKKSYTPHAGWTAMVQVRQHADHKRTLLFLEQLILKHQLASRLLNVVEKPDGLDFCFPSRQNALQFSAFCESRFPCLLKQSKQLISHDASSNTHFHKYTISVTLAPLCRDDLVYVHRKQAHTQLGGFPSLALCSRVAGAGIQLLDSFTGRTTHVSVEKYWRAPFQPLCTRKHLSSFLVLDVTPVDPPCRGSAGQQTSDSAPHQQQQQRYGHAGGGGGGWRRRRRRRHVLEGGLAAESEDDEWQKELQGGKNKREGRGAAAARRKRQLFGETATERHNSISSGVSFGSHCTPASMNGGTTADRMETEEIFNGPSQQTRGVKTAAGQAHQHSRVPQLYEVELMRGCDVGVCDRRVITRTHIGDTLQPGDWVQGYDLRSINLAGAVDSLLDEDARASLAAGPRSARRRRRRAGGGAARSSGGGGKNESSDSAEDMAVDGETQLSRRQGGKTSSPVPHDDSSDEDAGAPLLESTGELQQNEEEEENSLLRSVQYEVIIVKKQPLRRLCAAAERGATEGKGSTSRKVQQNGCKVRPWVLQTLQKERDTGMNNGQQQRGKRHHEGGKRGGGWNNHGADDSDAEMEAFKDELEEDPEMRAQVNLWRDPRYSEKKGQSARRGTKKKADPRGKASSRGTAPAATATGGESGVKENGERGSSAANKTEKGDADAEEWEDYDSDGQSLADDGETAGIKLAELLEGLTLEDGRLKGIVVQPGGRQAASLDDYFDTGPTVSDTAACEEGSAAGESLCKQSK